MLLTEEGTEMLEADGASNPVPLSSYGVRHNSRITLRVVVSKKQRLEGGLSRLRALIRAPPATTRASCRASW